MEEKISRDFTWQEMTHSATAEANGIANQPGREEQQALEELVKRLLQPLRMVYGRPIRITSGYRCAELNRMVKGSASSQHMKGEAADCVVEDAEELLRVLQESRLPFDQAILYRRRNFVHLSLKPEGNNRHRVIINR